LSKVVQRVNYFLYLYVNIFRIFAALICTVGEIKDGLLRIGDTSVPVYSPETKTKVPDVLFYENAQVTVQCIVLKSLVTDSCGSLSSRCGFMYRDLLACLIHAAVVCSAGVGKLFLQRATLKILVLPWAVYIFGLLLKINYNFQRTKYMN